MAKPIGEDFPKVIFNFLCGLILQGLDDEVSMLNDDNGDNSDDGMIDGSSTQRVETQNVARTNGETK